MQLDPSTDGLMRDQVTLQTSQWLRRFREIGMILAGRFGGVSRHLTS